MRPWHPVASHSQLQLCNSCLSLVQVKGASVATCFGFMTK